MIVLYGASGYTGRLVAAELAAVGAEFVVAGRARTRLDAVVDDLAGQVAGVRVADAHDPAALAAMLRGADAVVSTVGPFEYLGMPVVDAAVAAGVAYCDSTGEPAFMRRVAERHGSAAVPVAPACGFDYVPHDLAAAVAAEGMDRVDRLDTLLGTHAFATSQGTKLSAIGALGAGSSEWLGGRWAPTRLAADRRRFDLAGVGASATGVSYPGGDPVQIVNHVDAPTVRSYMEVPAAVAAVAGPAGWLAGTVGASGWVRERLESLARRGPEGPSAEARRRTTWRVVAEASGGGQTQTAVASGSDVYGLTGRLLARIAIGLQDWRGAGVAEGFRAPADLVVDPFEFASEAVFDLERVR